jgi:hypothetical protein
MVKVKLSICQLLALLATCFVPSSCLANSLALKLEVTCSSEALVNFQYTTQHYIVDDRTLIIILICDMMAESQTSGMSRGGHC